MSEKYYELTLTLQEDFVEFISDFIANITHDALEIGKNEIIIRTLTRPPPAQGCRSHRRRCLATYDTTRGTGWCFQGPQPGPESSRQPEWTRQGALSISSRAASA